MRRRYLLVPLFILAGCATPANRTPPPPGTPPSEAPAPAPGAPITPPAASGDMQFDAWAASFFNKAVAAGLSPDFVQRQMAGLTPDPRIQALDTRQPEFSKPISAYIEGTVTDGRAAAGERKLTEVPHLDEIQQTYGVPKEILLGVWAMESGFGAIQGRFDVIRSMATLAAQGRRREFAEDQLIAALKMIASGEVTREQEHGSWAGAMGQTQFIPTTYLSTAVDADGDGKRDIWGSAPDALASAANLLAKGGWVRGQDWAREVTVPSGFDFSLTEGPKQTPSQWVQLGVKRADGLPWPAADQDVPAELVAPAGANGPLFLLFPNHFVIRKYNNSLSYALAVGLLADRFDGRQGVIKPWPAETPLSLVDRLTAQRALAALGYDVGAPDGLIGMKTRTALRAWQKSRGLVADGYLSEGMVLRLKSEAQNAVAAQAASAILAPSDSPAPALTAH